MSSVINGLIDYGIEVGTKSVSVYARGSTSGVGNYRSGHKPTWANGPQLCDCSAVAGQHEGPPRLDLSKHRGGLVTEFSLGDHAIHSEQRSTCSTLWQIAQRGSAPAKVRLPGCRAILHVLATAKRQFRLHLRPDDILAEAEWPDAPPTLDAVQQALGQLIEWRNLQARSDTARVSTIEDFYRKRQLYRMTGGGEAVEAGLQAFSETLARRAELQSVALDDIRARLISIRELMNESPPDSAKIHGALRDLMHIFVGLQGVPVDYQKAFEWWTRAANQGQPVAQNNLGSMYLLGHGVDKDYVKAAEWYRRPAESGDREAQNSLGTMYYMGWGVSKDPTKGLAMVMKAAEQGSLRARRNAVAMMEAEAKVGNAEAMHNVGTLCIRGWAGDQKPEDCMKWYEEAARHGIDAARSSLAQAYEQGLWGLAVDAEKARYWKSQIGKPGLQQSVANK